MVEQVKGKQNKEADAPQKGASDCYISQIVFL
jgi:hypothetical protein